MLWLKGCYCILSGLGNLQCMAVWPATTDTTNIIVRDVGSPNSVAGCIVSCQHHSACTSQWRHNERDGVSNHQPRDCLLNRVFSRRSKKTSNLRFTGLCEGNSPVTGELSIPRASNAENVSIWWRHHGTTLFFLYSHRKRTLSVYALLERSRCIIYNEIMIHPYFYHTCMVTVCSLCKCVRACVCIGRSKILHMEVLSFRLY